MKRNASFRLAGLAGLIMTALAGSVAQADSAYDNGYTYQTLPPPPPPIPAEGDYPPPPALPDEDYDQSYYPPVTSLDQVPAIPGAVSRA